MKYNLENNIFYTFYNYVWIYYVFIGIFFSFSFNKL